MDENSLGAILEDIDGKLSGIAESVGSMNERLTRVETTVNEIPEMKDDIKAIKAAVKDQNLQIDDHETRISSLEAA